MKRTFFPLLAAFVLALTMESPAQAQPPTGPGQRPSYSPYLNLFRRGTPFYQNYYGLVRPQQEFNNSLQQIQQEVNANRAANTADEQQANVLPGTGHSFGYQTHLARFQNHTRGGTGMGGRSTGGTTGNVGSFGGSAGGVRPPQASGAARSSSGYTPSSLRR